MMAAWCRVTRRACSAATAKAPASFDFDLAVVGGGSGGLATAKRAAKHGAKVVLFDAVQPSTQGTTWGLGGTCVNVGCVPKKLMHHAALIGTSLDHDAKAYGWQAVEGGTNEGRSDEPSSVRWAHDWGVLRRMVQAHVKSLNFAYGNGLRSNAVHYVNGLARFETPWQLACDVRGTTQRVTARNVVIATGTRPHVPTDIPGVLEHCVTSDDLFSLPKPPGKTLCVGAGYVALECAGFLTGLGFDVTVAVRSVALRGFDVQCGEKVVALMEETGTKFKRGCTPTSVSRMEESGRLRVTFSDGSEDVFDTVLYATGRVATTRSLGLEHAGVPVAANGKLVCSHERVEGAPPHVYALGDVVQGVPELTPVAIQAGELLADRMFGGASAVMDYELVPTTVFTPFEYGCCGLSEEQAVQRYGADDVEVYLFEFSSLELAAAHRPKHKSLWDEFAIDTDLSPACLSKLVCVKSQQERVVGVHFVGPNAGEVLQGFALALRLGATKRDFDAVVGIHPTDAESFTAMDITRASGESWVASGMCGGGKCG